MTATDLERKVRQHDTDISAMHTMIADVHNTQRRHTNRFNELTEDVGALGDRMDSLETRMTSMETRMTSLETKVGSLETKLDQVLDLLQR